MYINFFYSSGINEKKNVMKKKNFVQNRFWATAQIIL